MRTGLIRYNVRERGRTHRGADRNFDTATLARLINGGDVQERVANRDMHGYYGHWPRVLFGMNPVEGGMVDGKQVTLEPALTLTSLRADPDGTIEYEAEFNDTPPGRVAYRQWKSKRGGFSSAIDCRMRNGVAVPVGFFGFDYVLEPNFTNNRGYALDAVEVPDGEAMLMLDGVVCSMGAGRDGGRMAMLDGVAEMQANMGALERENRALQSAHDLQSQTLLRLQEENNELLGMLAKGGGAAPVLDGVSGFTRPMRCSAARDFEDLVHGFDSVKLHGYAAMPGTDDDRAQIEDVDRAAEAVLGRRR